MELRLARRLATEVAEMMKPYCERIQLAGSIRRDVPEVKDLELVVIPKWEQRPDPASLMGDTCNVNLLWEAMQPPQVIVWIKPGTSEIVPWPIKPDGKYWRGLILKGRLDAPADVKVDVFIATPENYGVIFAIRTGSADFSRALVTYARDKTPYRVQEGHLIDDHQIGRPKIECADEQMLFGTLGLRYVEPRFRRTERDIRPLE